MSTQLNGPAVAFVEPKRQNRKGDGSVTRDGDVIGVSPSSPHPSPEKRLLGIPKSAKRRNAPHSRRFAPAGARSDVAKPLECAVFRRFRRTASRAAASLARGLTQQLQAGRVQVPSRSFSG